MLQRTGDIGFGSRPDGKAIAGVGRNLEIRHRRQAIAVADTAQNRARPVEYGRIEFRLDQATVDPERKAGRGIEVKFEFNPNGVRLGHIEHDA